MPCPHHPAWKYVADPSSSLGPVLVSPAVVPAGSSQEPATLPVPHPGELGQGYGGDIIGSSNSYLIATGRGPSSGYSKTRFPSSSFSDSPDTTLDRKNGVGRNAGYEGSSSGNSSPELSRKEFSSSNTRGRSQGRESAIRARLQSASPNGRWTELEDVKRLLKGSRSASTSPPRSAPNTLPYPKKAMMETKIVSANTQSASGRYDTTLLDPAMSTFNWTSTVPPSSCSVGLREYRNNLTTTGMQMSGTTGSTSVSAHTVHKNKAASPSAASVGLTSTTVQGLQNNLVANSSALTGTAQTLGTHTQVLGVQKNQVSNSTSVVTSGNSSTALTLGSDGMLDKDYRFVLLDKEKSPAAREPQLLIMAKDSGKLFTTVPGGFSASVVDGGLKKEQLVPTREGADITAQSHGHLKMAQKDKATYADVGRNKAWAVDDGDGDEGHCLPSWCSCCRCSWWKWLLALLLASLLLLGLLFGLIALAEQVRMLRERVSALEATPSFAKLHDRRGRVDVLSESNPRLGETSSSSSTDIESRVWDKITAKLQSREYRDSVRGEQGGPGVKGDPGFRGLEGTRGQPGTPGLDGQKGQKGSTGDHGEKGAKGTAGDAGRSVRGEKGERGDVGSPGITGMKGRSTINPRNKGRTPYLR
ncbi:collagen, type XVII, alpha 1a [Rhinoraja longicauda]